MGRYANNGQEVLYRNGKLIGVNIGYGMHAEHEYGYQGEELGMMEGYEDNPFNGEIMSEPELVNLMELNDGNVWMTNNAWKYLDLMRRTEEERKAYIDKLINNYDREMTESFLKSLGFDITSPEIVALWSSSSFDLISTTVQSSELIKRLYDEIQRGNVAVSSDYSFLFKNRGLSFVLLDALSNDDLLAKQLVDSRTKMMKQFEKEYHAYLSEQGLNGWGKHGEYPIEFWNLQIHDIKQDIRGEVDPEFYLEILDTSKGRENLDSLCMHNLPSYLSGSEIKALVPIVQSAEYAEYAKSHTQAEVEQYLIEELGIIRQRETVEAARYLADKEALGAIAESERTGTVEEAKISLGEKVTKWLYPNKEKDKDKPEGKGE